MTNPAEVSFPFVPQRRAAKMAESKIKTIKTYKDRKSISSSRESTSSAPASPPSPASSTSSIGDEVILIPPSAHPPPTRKPPPPPSATPVRTAHKRNAAQAAQQNIQHLHQSYAGLDGFDTSVTASSSKKKRLSNVVRIKVEQDSKSTPSSAPPTTTHPRKAARKQASQSTSSAARTPAPLRGRRFQDDQGVVWELQVGSCQAAHNRNWRKCVHCITKRAGDTCRFVDFRAFQVDPHTDKITPPDQDPHLASSLPLFTRLGRGDGPAHRSRHLPRAPFPSARATSPERYCPSSRLSSSTHASQTSFEGRARPHAVRCANFAQPASFPPAGSAVAATLPHATADLVPLTRFDEALLEQEVSAMRQMLTDAKTDGVRASAPARDAPAAAASTPNEASEQFMPKTEDEQRTPVNWKDVPTNQAGITADRIVGHLDLRTFDRASFDTDDFRCEWAHGEPLLVRDVTGPMHHPWGPDALQSRYGRDHCLIVRSDVEIAELKQPDLGPKMYNAWPGSEAPGGNGTTRLHMDIADAVNIMLHASPPTGDDVPEEHRPGVAAWDIFRAQDADKLRAFFAQRVLAHRLPGRPHTHPALLHRCEAARQALPRVRREELEDLPEGGRGGVHPPPDARTRCAIWPTASRSQSTLSADGRPRPQRVGQTEARGQERGRFPNAEDHSQGAAGPVTGLYPSSQHVTAFQMFNWCMCCKGGGAAVPLIGVRQGTDEADAELSARLP
ncbi:hypothetical protein L1887_47612 [Cichorium endivia]|nr:hypothetical protein L1887_47612 [Cichorium endivia]